VTTTEQILGTWEEAPTLTNSKSMVLLDATQLAEHWRRCSISSDFLARYTALFVPEVVPAGMLRRSAVENVLSYLLNELFENTAKFSGGPILTVCYRAWILEERIIFQLTNHISPTDQASFINLIQELLEGDVDTLYFQKM
jgi:hypothetical protein